MIEKTFIDLSEYRVNKANDMLSQAEILYKSQKYDGSINRSYYAILNGIRSLLALVNLDSSKHTGVLSYFDKYFVKTAIFEKNISKIAHAAFDTRQDNDYEDFYIPSEEEARMQLKEAKYLISEIKVKRKKLINQELNLPVVED